MAQRIGSPRIAPARAIAGRVLLTLALGAIGGALFAHVGLPLPWLLGPLAATTVTSLTGARLNVPDGLRRPMIALLGVMLGSTFTPDRVNGALDWLPSLAALPFYVLIVGALIFLYLRRFSDFDPTTAFFAASPGGLSEMILLSGQLGGDQRRVSLVHGTRLLFIVFAIPFLARIFEPAAIATVAQDTAAPMAAWEMALLAVLGGLGYVLACRLHLPAATFVGPLLASSAIHLSGIIEHQPPYVLLASAQLVIGAAVGARFSGAPLALVGRSLLLGAGATLIMLAITLLFGAILHGITAHPLPLLLLAFIPGGFAEMSLIALAMGVDPAFVVTHHSLRVFLVVLIALPVFAWLKRSGRLATVAAEAD